MKILLCHLTLSMGPLEENLKILERAVQIAGEVKADWVVTPETAVQGYHFYKIDPEQKLGPQPAEYLTPLRNLVRKNRQYLFLGAGEYDVKDNCNYNTCFVFGPDGELIGKHRKNHSHGYHDFAFHLPPYSFPVSGILCLPLPEFRAAGPLPALWPGYTVRPKWPV